MMLRSRLGHTVKMRNKPQEDLHVAKARSLSEFELHNLTGFYDGTPVKSAALVELERRKLLPG